MVKPVMLNHPRPHVKVGAAGLNVTLWVTGNLSGLLGDGCIRVEGSLGLAVFFEMFRLWKTNAIFYQLAVVSRDCTGSPGRNFLSLWTNFSLADRN